MLKRIFQTLGYTLAVAPACIPKALSYVLGLLVYLAPTSRRYTLLSQLHHAYPDKSNSWRKSIARKSCVRTIETGLFVLAAPYFSRKRIEKQFALGDLSDEVQKIVNSKDPVVCMIPHTALMEASIFLPVLLSKVMDRKIGVVYRPFENKSIEAWVKASRSRFGAEMLSRKSGFYKAKDILSEGGAVVVLFDQNAGLYGTLSIFWDRVCSSSHLPALFLEKSGAKPLMLYVDRTGHWSGELKIDYLPEIKTQAALTDYSNLWLENRLKESENLCASWLWLHQRWRHQDIPRYRFRLQSKRNALAEIQALRGWDHLPRNTRFWIRMPNWLGDIIMALPLIRALEQGRPDVELTLICRAHFKPFLEELNIGHKVRALPEKGCLYWLEIARWRQNYPDLVLTLTNSFRGDLEAWLLRAPQRFGMKRPGKCRPLLTHTWNLGSDIDETQIHQFGVWKRYFEYFGLEVEPELKPLLQRKREASKFKRLGLICGTENAPEKRWPVTHWRELIESFEGQGYVFELFGTVKDRELTAAVASGFTETVTNRAGDTSLVEFIEALQQCDAVICNDTGGMHLANALGVPVFALFGPTNPVRTGPVYRAPTQVLQPHGAPSIGGKPIDELTTDSVHRAIATYFSNDS